MTDPQRLRTYLEGARDFAGKLPPQYCYRNVYDFVLREGKFSSLDRAQNRSRFDTLASVFETRS